MIENVINKKGEINYDRLRQATDAIFNGTAVIDRLSLAEEQGRRQGGRRNVEASVLLAANARTNGAKICQKSAGTAGTAEHQECILKEYAKNEGIWILFNEIDRWKYQDAGMEARVYEDNKPGYIRKIVYNYRNFSENMLEYLDNRISLHNYLFGESNTDYELIGFTETYGATKNVKGKFFAPVIRQKYIIGEELDQSQIQALDIEMLKRGFKKINDKYVNKDYIIKDLHVDNVLIDKDGNFFFIDTVPMLNTKGKNMGGTREYKNMKIRQL